MCISDLYSVMDIHVQPEDDEDELPWLTLSTRPHLDGDLYTKSSVGHVALPISPYDLPKPSDIFVALHEAGFLAHTNTTGMYVWLFLSFT